MTDTDSIIGWTHMTTCTAIGLGVGMLYIYGLGVLTGFLINSD